MKILNKSQRDMLSILLEKKFDDYHSRIDLEELQNSNLDYLTDQMKEIMQALKTYGYCARYDIDFCFLHATLTPEGISYFQDEEKYQKEIVKSKNIIDGSKIINIQTLNANGSNLNLGNMYDSKLSIESSFNQIEEMIEQNGKEDKEELNQLLEEVKDYVENISKTQTIGKNKNLFKRLGDHFEKHQWFYQMIVELIGKTVINTMSGN